MKSFGLLVSLPARLLFLFYFQMASITVFGLSTMTECYVCKYDPTGTAGLITPCPDIANKLTTVQEGCPDGTCLTFTGTQEWRGKSIDGILRLCLTRRIAAIVFQPSWILTENQPQQCQMVNTTSLHKQSTAEPCTIPPQVLKITGQACTCRGNLCNAANATSFVLTSTWRITALLLFAVFSL